MENIIIMFLVALSSVVHVSFIFNTYLNVYQFIILRLSKKYLSLILSLFIHILVFYNCF